MDLLYTHPKKCPRPENDFNIFLAIRLSDEIETATMLWLMVV